MRFYLIGFSFLSILFSCGRADTSVFDERAHTQSFELKGLPPAKDFNLSSPIVGHATFSSLFTGHHLVIDLSAAFCSACVGLANDLKYDKEAQRWFNGERCSFVTVVDASDIDKWLQRVGDTSYAAQHSYSVDEGIGGVSYAYGVDIQSLPGIMIIDRNGNVVVTKEGELPAETGKICSE